jgi:dipeptidyl aminopeptidase/acylaminoacyl peptidase
VLGLSGGGFMVNWLLGHYPGTFAAGVSENPVTDFTGMFGESDIGQLPPENFIGLTPLWEDPAAWLPRSPYTLLHKNEAPLLLIHCDRDQRCPPGQSELAFAILRSLGRTVEMIRYPEEPHYLVGIGRPDRRVDRIERIVAWFELHL